MYAPAVTVSGQSLPTRFRDGKSFFLLQQPWFNGDESVASYLIGERKDAPRRAGLVAGNGPMPQIQGLEIKFGDVTEDFQYVLNGFVRDVATHSQPRKPFYETTEQLLDGAC